MEYAKGSITFQVFDEEGNFSREYEVNNNITNEGLSGMVRGNMASNLALGQGRQPEDLDPTITSLVNYTGGQGGYWSTVRSSVAEGDEIVSEIQLTVNFPKESSGKNYTECGLYSNNKDALWTYALFVDSQGSPVVITVVTGEQVKALYNIEYRMPATSTFNLDVGGVPTTMTQVVLNLAGSSSIRLPESSRSYLYGYFTPQVLPDPLGSSPPDGTRSNKGASHNNGAYTFVPWETNWNKENDLHMLVVGNNYKLAWSFDPPIPMSFFEGNNIQYKNDLVDSIREAEYAEP